MAAFIVFMVLFTAFAAAYAAELAFLIAFGASFAFLVLLAAFRFRELVFAKPGFFVLVIGYFVKIFLA